MKRGEGGLQWRATGVYLRVRMPDGSRPLIPLGPPTMSEAMAEERAAAWRENREERIRAYLADRAQPAAPKSSSIPTFEAFARRWTSGELARLYPDHVPTKDTSYDDEKRLAKHVFPKLGPKLLDEITIDDADEVMRALPSTLSASSRRHIAQLMSRVLALAVQPARLLKASPIPRGYLPLKGARKALAYLYPDEERVLLGTVAVPLCYRVLYGFLNREGMRAGEAAALTWADLDLGRGAVKLDENKTDDPRAWALGRDVVLALAAWREVRALEGGAAAVAPGAPVFIQENGAVVNVDRGAERFRAHIQAAGVARAELFERTAARRPIRLHDTRATFVTVSLANGRTETWVKDRTGHRSSQMVENYRRAARALAELNLGPLAAMDQAIPEFRVGHEEGDEPGRGGSDVDRAEEAFASESASVHERGVEPLCLAAPEPKAVSEVAIRRFSPHSDVFAERRRDGSQRLSAQDAHSVGHEPMHRIGGGSGDPELDVLARAVDDLASEWDALESAAGEDEEG